MKGWFRLAGLALPFLLLTPAQAEVVRYAILVGANAGDPGEVLLRYAESDVQRVGRVLTTVGGFHPEDVIVLTNVRAEDVQRALIGLNARIRQTPGESLLFLFYSGHADAENLHLSGTRLATSALRALVVGSPAGARVLVLDACRSGALTRVKGGRRGPSFDIQVDQPLGAQGIAILTSSAAGEDSQESDQLGASFFTHYLTSALLGAADRDQDGRVTLSEAFSYASERTLNATVATFAGPQHPTYRVDLGGRDDLVLTQPGAGRHGFGVLEFPNAGVYLVHRRGGDGPVVAELATEDAGRRLALEAGRYHVTRRDTDSLLQGEFAVTSGATTRVDPERMRRLAYARVVRKGGTERSLALSVFASGGVRGEIFDLGTAWRADVGGRIDFSALSLELRLGLADSPHQNQNQRSLFGTNSRELSASVVGLRAFDFSRGTLGIGLEAGAAWMSNLLSIDTTSFGLYVGPLVQIEWPIASRFLVRLDGGMLTYFLPIGTDGSTTETPVTYRAGAGFGVYF